VPPESRLGRRRALRLVGFAVLLGLAAIAVRHVDLASVWGAMAAARPSFLALAAGANVLSLAAHSRRWAAVVRPPHGRVRFGDAFAAVVAGFAVGIVVPARAGDVLRAWLLARRADLPTASVLAAAALDYIVGAAALVPLLALLALATPLPSWALRALLAFAVVALAGVLAAFLLRPRRGVRASGHGLAGLGARLRAGLAATHEPQALAASFAWGLAGWGAEVLIGFLVLEALGLPGGLTAAALAVLASTAANIVAVSPGNTGPFELAVVLALGGLGIAREPALAFALLYHLVHLVPVALMGGFVLLREVRPDERAIAEPEDDVRDRDALRDRSRSRLAP
jgi:uncharacterized membrane protein YbhN (UPF0104 family)